jgi:hypothetical protein
MFSMFTTIAAAASSSKAILIKSVREVYGGVI